MGQQAIEYEQKIFPSCENVSCILSSCSLEEKFSMEMPKTFFLEEKRDIFQFLMR
jgi:hypothetical protein